MVLGSTYYKPCYLGMDEKESEGCLGWHKGLELVLGYRQPRSRTRSVVPPPGKSRFGDIGDIRGKQLLLLTHHLILYGEL